MSKFGWSYPAGAAEDPFAPYNQEECGADCDQLIDALKAHDTGRWDWDKIDCCLTGKDADLEPWGDQGVEIVSCDDTGIKAVAHVLKTFAGSDVCLNLESELEDGTDGEYEQALDAYLDQAQEVICGCGVPGEWDGDSWVLSDRIPFRADWKMVDGEPDCEQTAQLVADAAAEALRHVEQELIATDQVLNMLAGWTDGFDGNDQPIKCEAGKPGRYAAWRAH